MLQILLIIFLFFGLLLFLTKKLFLPTERNDFSWLSKERSYLDPKTQKQLPFPSYKEPASVELSVIVPAYNEEERISVMLDEALGFLKEKKQKQPGFTFEIIVVDDGSKDKTDSIVWRYSEKEGSEIVRLVKLEKNMGKGGALKVGMMCGRGRFLLMADADGATTFSDLERLEKSMKEILKDDQGIVVGSRAHLVNTNTVTSRKWYRNLLMYFFHLLVQMCVKGIRDTQCGFKLFSRKAAQALFPSLHVNRWAFDVELLYLATNHLHIPVAEASVNWTEIEGSKLDPLTSSFQMARDLMRIRLCYLFSVWSMYEERKKGK